jgi:hypothetical protein
MTRFSREVHSSCSLDRAFLTLGRDSVLRRSYLRKRWQSSHRPSGAYQTAPRPIARQLNIAIEHPAIHINET